MYAIVVRPLAASRLTVGVIGNPAPEVIQGAASAFPDRCCRFATGMAPA